MVREVIATGADVGEAREKALELLGENLPENIDVDFEILEMPKKKVLGLFGGCPAKVRAFYEIPDEKPLKRVEKYERSDKKSAGKKSAKPQKAVQPKKAEQPQKEVVEEPAQPKKLELVPIEDETKKAAVDTGVAFVKDVLSKMEVEASVTGGQLGSNLAIVLEGDHLVLERLKLDINEQKMMGHIIKQMETERGLDHSAAVADMRFDFINKVCSQTVTKPKESKEHIRSQKIDRFLTGKYTAIPSFILIMVGVFYLTFNVIGAWLQGLMEMGVEWITELIAGAMAAANVNEALQSLVVDGMLAGVGSVLSFLPIIVTLFFFLSLLEDSGYIARVAFVMDKLLRKIGLSGRSIVPMLIGFGCTVPAVMATRTLPSERDRKMTILLTPFMSCTAKLPIYAFFVNAFFPENGGPIMAGLYVLGIVAGILVAFLYKNVLFKGEAVPFVMELPNYRLPSPKNVAQLLWEKAKDFLQRAFSVILIATVVIWFLQSFDFHMNMVASSEDSILAAVSGLIAPILKPIGLGDWRICTALISGFMAKESVVSTLEVLFAGSVQTAMSSLSAACLLVFSLLYTPCVAAIASIRRELGSKWAVGVVFWQCFVAWGAALIVRLIGMAIGL